MNAPVSKETDRPTSTDRTLLEPGDARLKRLRYGFLSIVLVMVILSALLVRYLWRPAPLPELIPVGKATYPPHYLFSIYGVDRPVGIALSPDGERIYVSESGGERFVRVFDRQGSPQGAFAAADTSPSQRAQVYLAVSPRGDIYLSDRTQHAVFVFNYRGQPVDILLGSDLSLGCQLAMQTGTRFGDAQLSYNIFTQHIQYSALGAKSQGFAIPDKFDDGWSPLGVRFDLDGSLWVTNVAPTDDQVQRIDLHDRFEQPTVFAFGENGKIAGQLNFPNVAMPDSKGRVYISDGNNWRVSVYDSSGNYLYHFGLGTDDMSLKLPRGLFVDHKDRLYVVDAVDHKVKAFDVSADRAVFLFEFGELGIGDGYFQYPNDIAVDQTGRLYIADRENNRIQVWSY